MSRGIPDPSITRVIDPTRRPPNTSSAVMNQRVEPADSLDDFPTPAWATRALCEHVLQKRSVPTDLSRHTVWEPACGRGTMARPLQEYFREVVVSDVFDYGYGEVYDFLSEQPRSFLEHDWVITNPPFRLGEDFIKRGFLHAQTGVAMLVRTAFVESVGRYKNLFEPFPPRRVAQFTERVPMFKGRLDRKASTATSYCWIVWEKGWTGKTEFSWIPPCRAQLDRDTDWVM